MTNAREWLILDTGSGHYDFNMALDEALLEAMPRLGRPVLRFYGWIERAASFGYFQNFALVEHATLLRPLVRRPTAGGLVPHDADWTYSLAFPATHDWYAFKAVESYRRAHEWIQTAFAMLGIHAEIASASKKELAGQCFAGYERDDVLWNGRKIAGAAQRRTREGLLIQGSVQPPQPALSRAEWQRALCEAGVSKLGIHWQDFQLDTLLSERSSELANEKYSQPHYNRKR